MRSNCEYHYFGNVLEYEYDYFPSYSSTSTQKVLVLEYEYTSTITPSLLSKPSKKMVHKFYFWFEYAVIMPIWGAIGAVLVLR